MTGDLPTDNHRLAVKSNVAEAGTASDITITITIAIALAVVSGILDRQAVAGAAISVKSLLCLTDGREGERTIVNIQRVQ